MITNDHETAYAGDTLEITFACTQADGSALPLAGVDLFVFVVRGGATIVTLTSDDGDIVTTATAGQCVATLTPAQTVALSGVYEIILRARDGVEVMSLARIPVTFRQMPALP